MVRLTMAVLFLAGWVVCFCQDFEVQEDEAGGPTIVQYEQDNGGGNTKKCYDIHGKPKKCDPDIPLPLDNTLGLICLGGAAVVSFFYLKKHRENGYNQ